MTFGLFILKHTKLNLIYLNKFKKDINCNSNCNSNIIFFGKFSTKTSFLLGLSPCMSFLLYFLAGLWLDSGREINRSAVPFYNRQIISETRGELQCNCFLVLTVFVINIARERLDLYFDTFTNTKPKHPVVHKYVIMVS